MKACVVCGREKARSDFHKYARAKDGLKPQCKPCRSEYESKVRRQNHGPKLRQADRVRRIKTRFKITIEEYEALLSLPCAICGDRSTALDHDHETGAIREALCNNCNAGIGMMGDSVERVASALAYLVRHSGTRWI